MARRTNEPQGWAPPAPGDEAASDDTALAMDRESATLAGELDDPADTDDDTKPAKGGADELTIIRSMVARMDKLPNDSARHRALDWLVDYYGEHLAE